MKPFDKMPTVKEIGERLEGERVLDCGPCTKCKNAKEQFKCLYSAKKQFKFSLTLAVFGAAVSLFACFLMVWVANLPTATFLVKTFDAIAFAFNAAMFVLNIKRAIRAYAGYRMADKVMLAFACKLWDKGEKVNTPQGASQ